MSTFNISKISFVFENYEFSFVYFEIVYPLESKGVTHLPDLPSHSGVITLPRTSGLAH